MWEDKIVEKTPKNDLLTRAIDLKVEDIANIVIEDHRFNIWSGSGARHHHHYGNGRLKAHTEEVINLCFENANYLKVKINPQVLFLGGLFHDYGKCWDYNGNPMFDNWVKVDHSRTINHLSRSAVEWAKAVQQFGDKYKDLEEPVLHLILSHHGNRAYGSPVTPFSREAWLLHLCDSLSARMDDCHMRDQIDGSEIKT